MSPASGTIIRHQPTAATFTEQELLETNGCSIASETEVIELPAGYDEGGKPPRFRVVLRRKGSLQTCESLEEIARAISLMDFPIMSFAEKYPGQIASMLANVAGLPRPVQNHMLYQFVESDYGIRLGDVAPAVVGVELRWFELPASGSGELNERRLVMDSFALRD